jgi:hypothetical protein
MDSKGRTLDNIFIERLWRSLKYEEVYINDYETPRDARNGISEYLGFYNSERPHQSLRYLTPAEVYCQGMIKLRFRAQGSLPSLYKAVQRDKMAVPRVIGRKQAGRDVYTIL